MSLIMAANARIVLVGGTISELVDIVCGNGLRRKTLPPFPDPDPDPRVGGHELGPMGGELISFPKWLANEALGVEFSARLKG